MLNSIQPYDKIKLKQDKSIIGDYISETQRRKIVYGSIHNTPFLTKEDINQLINDTKAQP